MGTQITQITPIFADCIRVNPSDPRHPRSIFRRYCKKGDFTAEAQRTQR